MPLTSAQRAALRADIAADPALAQLPVTQDSSYAIAAAYNALASPDFLVWNTATPVQSIYDAITWSAYTPTDAPDSTATYTNRLLVIQTKQMNLQNMLQGRSTVDASLQNFRAGLRDAVVALPAGAAGAAVSAGGASGATVLTACTRKATRAEKLFSTGNQTTGSVTASIMGYVGTISPSDVDEARAN